MKPRIIVGQPHLTLSQGYTVMACERSGQIQGGQLGLFFLDTRLISAWRVLINGCPWTLLNGGALSAAAGRAYFVNPQTPSPGGTIAAKALGLTLNRHIDGGLHEDIEIVNHCQEACHFVLEIVVSGDFADIFEVKAGKTVQRGTIQTDWDTNLQRLTTRYSNADFSRAFRINAQNSNSPMMLANDKLSFVVRLAPAQTWHTCLMYDFANGDDWTFAPEPHATQLDAGGAAKSQRAWRDEVVKLDSANEAFSAWFDKSLDDMAALRLPLQDSDDIKFVPAAGLPWFAALFGRDSLIISLQSTIVHPQFAHAALDALAHWQASERDDYRDAEPGKIHHELRRGELAHFRLIPHTPYYGTADATPLYLTTLHAAFMASGDRNMLEAHLDTAERCLAWIDAYGDRDGDGFQEYETRSRDGYENQSWKDSGEALVYPDGSLVKGPKATCELQGYVYDAWLRMAELFDILQKYDDANRLRNKANDLFERFNSAFWDETEGSYFFALDGDKKPVRSVASNPGHCLWSGIVPPERAKRLVGRLMRNDMFSGWGIRTLSSRHKSFNPFHYQIGAVWPHDNGLIAQGMARYGFREEACRVAQAVSDASDFFRNNEMPELYSGSERTPGSFPAQYLGANVPQGWAAGASFSLLQALLGFQPDAPAGRLYLDPALPDWMPTLTLSDLRLGDRIFDIRFARDGAETVFEVLRGPACCVAARPMSAWSDSLRAGRQEHR
jgi:glycogen debranching enzyme